MVHMTTWLPKWMHESGRAAYESNCKSADATVFRHSRLNTVIWSLANDFMHTHHLTYSSQVCMNQMEATIESK